MTGESYIEFRDFFTGSRLALVTGATGAGGHNGFLRLTTMVQVNAPGMIAVEVPGDWPFAAALPDKTLIIHWRRDIDRGIDWYRQHVGVFRDSTYTNSNDQRRWLLQAPGLLSLLSWCGVLWPAGKTNRTAFTATKAETIMKTLVQYNATASATAASGRDRDAPIYGVAVQTDAAGGVTLDWSANRSKSLLEELQALAAVAGGDIDLVYTSSTTREFRFYAGQRGTDKQSVITFAETMGNMHDVTFARLRSQERTAAVSAGQGEGDLRTLSQRTGTNYHATQNNIEVFVDAKDLNPDTAAAREARGDKRLDELTARDTFTFGVVQTQGIYFGPSGAGSYTLGDLVRVVRPDGTTVAQQVYRVTLDWQPGQAEHIGVEMRAR